jgi:hypothetical protein
MNRAWALVAGVLTLSCSRDDKKPDLSDFPDVAVPRMGGSTFAAADPHKVDINDVFKQAHARAVAVDSKAKLTYAIMKQVKGGFVDVTQHDAGGLDYQYRYLDPSKPPGADSVAGRISFKLGDGSLEDISLPPTKATPSYVEEPTCASADLWKSVVASGVPDNTVAQLELDRGYWNFTVAGHPELKRKVSAAGCAIMP